LQIRYSQIQICDSTRGLLDQGSETDKKEGSSLVIRQFSEVVMSFYEVSVMWGVLVAMVALSHNR
jgi:hypothetical protein